MLLPLRLLEIPEGFQGQPAMGARLCVRKG